MWRLRSLLASAAAAVGLTAPPAFAGGFMLPEGQGQIIAGVGYVEATRTFDKAGRVVPAPTYRKAAVGGFAEYGLTPWMTLIAAPTMARMQAGSSSNAYSGSDESAFGARLKLWGTDARTLALQALVEPPLGGRGNPLTEVALGGPNAAAADLRFQLGQALSMFGYPAFASVEPGARLRGGRWPDEARFDIAIGLYPSRRDLILLQGFASSAASAGPLIPRTAYVKLQLSYVYALSPAWSIQVGGARTIAGRNAARETGPFAGLWYRFATK